MCTYSRKRLLVTDRLHIAIRFHRAVVGANGERQKMLGLVLTEGATERTPIDLMEIRHDGHTEAMQLVESRWPDTPESLHLERVEEGLLRAGLDDFDAETGFDPIGPDDRLGLDRCELGEKLVGRHPNAAPQIEFIADCLPDLVTDLGAGSEEPT